ncbi:hypothetical protein DOY81_013772 [Sarcophaga bullata]|nr:hypothetical protein DOY81_013772 [Sarcophaga bullata]
MVINEIDVGLIDIQLTAQNDFFTDSISQPLLVEMDVVDGYMGLEANNFKDLQELELPRTTRSLDLQITGTGNIFIQFSYQYHVDPEILETPMLKSMHPNVFNARSLQIPKKSFAITTKVESELDDLTMEVEVCVVYQPEDDVKNLNTNMIIVDIDLPSGYIPNVENIAYLHTYEFIDRVNDHTPNKIILYFAYMQPNEQKCFTIKADRKDHVQNLQPSKITVYDYYHDKRREIVTYKL